VSWSPDDRRIARAGSAGVEIWDLAAKEATKISDQWSNAVAWHPTANKLATGVHMGIILTNVSDAERTMLEKGYGPFTAHGYQVGSLSWQPSAANLLAVDVWGRVALWSADGELLGAIWDHRIQQLHYFNAACCWTHDGRHFLTAAYDGTIRYYQAGPVEPQWVAVNLPDDKAVTFSPTGEILHGDRKVVEEELIYLVENEQGTIDMLTPTDFQERVNAASQNGSPVEPAADQPDSP
jgi:WD40 repeat protein